MKQTQTGPAKAFDINHICDHLGETSVAVNLLRFDDTWQPLSSKGLFDIQNLDQMSHQWEEQYGGPTAYNHPKGEFVRPLDLDMWTDPDTLTHSLDPQYWAKLSTKSVTTQGIQGRQFTIEIEDQRDPKAPWPERVIKLPVGIHMKYQGNPSVFGIREMYLEPEMVQTTVFDPSLKRKWFYLEAELFGLESRSPMELNGPAPQQWHDQIHVGAPLAIFSEDRKTWWGLAGEADYGAAIHWQDDGVLLYSTLYLKPQGKAQWHFTLWRQETNEPANVYLSATRPGGFFDQMNPINFERQGIPEGPIYFININRSEAQLQELEKAKPAMVILNYHYTHIAAVDMYDRWTNYEGFDMTEADLKALIARIRRMGAKVGFYGTSAGQPIDHTPYGEEDVVVDRLGRRQHAWEPGSWVADLGNRDTAEHLAQAEAEFASHYGFDCVFVDRLDYMSVNHNPARQGNPEDERLELIPSVRLGILALSKARMEWQRKLNPKLLVGVNNTTQWAGVRYSDFNNLEGGAELTAPIYFLNAPFGVIHKRHYNILFGDHRGDIVEHGIVDDMQKYRDSSFIGKTQQLFRTCLRCGVLPQPYEDEFFVDKHSMFYQGWNDKAQPTEDKLTYLHKIPAYGGRELREFWKTCEDAFTFARTTMFPVESVWRQVDSGVIPEGVLFSARKASKGALYVGLENTTDQEQDVAFTLNGTYYRAQLPPEAVQVWYGYIGKTLQVLIF